MCIRVSPHQELRHLALRLAIPATKINPLVSPSDPRESIFTPISLSLPSAESTNDIGREIGRTDSLLRRMREYVDTIGSRLSSTSREWSPRGHIACRRRG